MGLPDLASYVEYLFSDEGKARELVHLADAITTNKTDFFREPAHFDYLVEAAIPSLVDEGVLRGGHLSLWSAGCSSGEEPYTLAIVLSELAERFPPLTFSILASDLSTIVLEKGRTAIYDRDRIAPVPLSLQKKYFLQRKDRTTNEVRVKPSLRAKVEFRQINLMDSIYDTGTLVDVVFFRNVIIYFSRQTQASIVYKVCDRLKPGGFLFMGHSETLFGLDLPLDQVAPTIYRRRSS